MILIFLFTVSACLRKLTNEKENLPSQTTDEVDYLKNLDLLIQESPHDASLYSQRAAYYLDNDFLLSALHDTQKALEIDSTNTDYWLLLGDVYFKMGKFSESRSIIEKVVNQYPENMVAKLKYAEFQLYLADYPKVFNLVNEVLRQSPYNAKAYFLKGMAYLELKDTTLALSSFQTAVDIDPDYFHAHMQIGLINSAKLQPLCVEHFKQAMRLNPLKPESYYALGYYYQNVGRINEAIDTYKALLYNIPGNPAALFNLGYIYLLYKKEYPLAIQYFSEAVAVDSKYTEAYYNRGYAYELSGNKQAAIRDYQNALALNSNFDLALKGLKRLGMK